MMTARQQLAVGQPAGACLEQCDDDDDGVWVWSGCVVGGLSL